MQLEARLYPPPPAVAPERRPVPDWAVVHRELRRANMTLALLWEEYRNGPGGQDGFGYSWFCGLYREWAGRLKPTLRQVHPAGERVFVDFAGHTMEGFHALEPQNGRSTNDRPAGRYGFRRELKPDRHGNRRPLRSGNRPTE
jgi:hypothetical protein